MQSNLLLQKNSRFNLEKRTLGLHFLTVNEKTKHPLLPQNLPFLVIDSRRGHDRIKVKGQLVALKYQKTEKELSLRETYDLIQITGIEMSEDLFMDWISE